MCDIQESLDNVHAVVKVLDECAQEVVLPDAEDGEVWEGKGYGSGR